MDVTEGFDKLGPIAQTLAATVVPIDFRENTLESAIDYLQAISGVQIVVDWNALNLIGVDRDDAVTLQLSAVPLDAAFDLTLRQVGDDINHPIFEIREDESLVFVSSLEECRSDTVLVTYDVSNLIEQRLKIDPEVTRQQAAQDLVDTIEETVDQASWVSLGGESGTLRAFGDQLIVSNTRTNHAAIASLLSSLAPEPSPDSVNQGNTADELSTEPVDPLPPKPPETLQKLKWLYIHGIHHWKWIASAVLLIVGVWIARRYIPTLQPPATSQTTTPSQTRPPTTRSLVLELRSLVLQEVGDVLEGKKNPTRIEVYIDDKRVEGANSLDVYRMKDRAKKEFTDGEHIAVLGSYEDDFRPFELRVDVIDVDESGRKPKHPLLGRFVFTVSPSDLGHDLRPAGSSVEQYGDENVSLTLRIDLLKAG